MLNRITLFVAIVTCAVRHCQTTLGGQTQPVGGGGSSGSGVQVVVSHKVQGKVNELFVPDCGSLPEGNTKVMCQNYLDTANTLGDLPEERDTALCKGDYQGKNGGFQDPKASFADAACYAPEMYSCSGNTFQKKIFDVCSKFVGQFNTTQSEHSTRWSQGSSDGVVCNDQQITYENYLDVITSEIALIQEIANARTDDGEDAGLRNMFEEAFDDMQELEEDEKWMAKLKGLHALCCYPRESCEECVTSGGHPTPFLQLMCAELVPDSAASALVADAKLESDSND